MPIMAITSAPCWRLSGVLSVVTELLNADPCMEVPGTDQDVREGGSPHIAADLFQWLEHPTAKCLGHGRLPAAEHDPWHRGVIPRSRNDFAPRI